jgi:gliding motility-associated-like protein
MKLFLLRTILILCLFSPFVAQAQLVVNSGANANTLIQSLIGSGLQVSNIALNCGAGASGTFSNGLTTNLGIGNGIVLTTGSADSCGNTNLSQTSTSTCIGTTLNDPDLIAIDPTANNDVCILEFDIIPKCDSLTIRFVFGSEEYPIFVNSINDLFGFFITGPSPNGPPYVSQNIAVIPGNIPVSINNINNGNANAGPCMNCAYYIDNTNGSTIVYNGMTVVITAGIGLVPCQSYHFKIAIADASDCILDSGVFIDLLQCATSFTATTANTPDVCNQCNGTATVTVNGGNPPFSYQWLPSGGNAATASGLCAGTYSVLVTDANSCGIPDTFIVNVAAANAVTANIQQVNASCAGDCNASATVTPTAGVPPYAYVWSPNISATNSATGMCAGSYSVTITDSTGCSSTQTIVITQPTAIALALTGNDTICAGSTATITAAPSGGTGPYTVTWDNSLPNGTSQTVSPATTTTYNATVTDANGCNTAVAFTVVVSPAPTATFTASEGTCAPSTIQFTNATVGASSYVWDFGDPASGGNNNSVQSDPTHLYNLPGTYDVVLIASNGGTCIDTFTFVAAVTVFPDPIADMTSNTITVSELSPDVVFSDLSVGGTNCVLYFGDGDSINTCNFGNVTHSYPGPGTYTSMLIVTNASGCADTTYITVVVEEETTIYVPNAFTPNGDGRNDFFAPVGTNINAFEMLVFDRWGNLIFQTNDIAKGWDGTFKGNKCQQDVYVWRITYSDSRSKKHKLLGHVSLVR